MNTYSKITSIVALLSSMLMIGCSTDNNTSNSLHAESSIDGVVLAKKTCSMCHGITGQSISPTFPKLAGQQKEYLTLQLADFKGHMRSDPTGTQYMWGVTHLTALQIDTLADYFSKQAPMLPSDDSSPTPTARGKEIFTHGIPDQGVTQCSACHGTDGRGTGIIPRIAGQHANYLAKQIKVFKLTDARPRGGAMKEVTHLLSEEDITAVSNYVASMP